MVTSSVVRSSSAPGRVTRMIPLSLAVVLIAVGCGGGGDDEPAAKASTTPTTSAPGAKANTPAFIDILECESAGGTGTAKGTIENQGTEPVAYELTMGFHDGSGKELVTGSATTEVVAPGAEVEWTVTASGLGSVFTDDVVCKTATLKPVSGGASATTEPQGSSDEEFPCDLLTVDEVAQIAGNPLDGDATTSQVTENDRSWLARVCTWTGVGTGAAEEVTLSVTRNDAFPAGESACPPPMGDATPVAGIGAEAAWIWDDPGTTLKVGELRVCSPDAFVTVRVSGTSNEPQQRAVAKSVAVKALGGL